jgi:hypothetical protein
MTRRKIRIKHTGRPGLANATSSTFPYAGSHICFNEKYKEYIRSLASKRTPFFKTETFEPRKVGRPTEREKVKYWLLTFRQMKKPKKTDSFGSDKPQ